MIGSRRVGDSRGHLHVAAGVFGQAARKDHHRQRRDKRLDAKPRDQRTGNKTDAPKWVWQPKPGSSNECS